MIHFYRNIFDYRKYCIPSKTSYFTLYTNTENEHKKKIFALVAQAMVTNRLHGIYFILAISISISNNCFKLTINAF